ncbi:MAG: hypothetical protein CMJ18_16215 [Phycisphaeraceae bacterium]|nr:hypothetical protein [Phycisphaeraceae bacterium]
MSDNVYVVTGAAGWLGSRFVELLAGGAWEHPTLNALAPSKIRCLVLPGQDAALLRALGDRIQIVEGDIRKPEDCRSLLDGAADGVLVHTAGIIHPGRVREFYDINVDGTRNLLDAATAAGARRAVIMSSNSPIGCNPHVDHQFDEDSPYNPYMHYGRSKMRMEHVIQGFSEAGSLETATIRAPWFYGPNQPPRQTLFFTMIREGKAPIVGSGRNRRSMSYVDNLSQGLALAAVVPAAAGRTYWIADERPYSMNEIVDTVERLLAEEFGFDVVGKRMRLPGFAGDVARVVDRCLQATGLYHQKIHVLSEMNQTIACTVDRARAELGYQPRIELEEGMRRSIQWCLDQGLAI